MRKQHNTKKTDQEREIVFNEYSEKPLDELYQILFVKVDEWNKEKEHEDHKLTICPAVFGREEDSIIEEHIIGRPMFIGRAINGWCTVDGLENYKNRYHLCEQCGLGWVVGKRNWEYCVRNNCPVAAGESDVDGRINNTPFWQMIQYICKNALHIDSDWYKHIIWSNLYKASFEYGGNPKGFYEEQAILCNAILIKEIERYQPSYICFITEKNTGMRTWFCRDWTTDAHFKELYQFLKDTEYGKRVVVLTRPEYKNKDKVWRHRQDLEGNRIETK